MDLPRILASDEAPAFQVWNEHGASPLFFLCDHASNRMPRALGTLGLDEPALGSHIAWDPGALDVARALSEDLDAPVVASGYSRLAIDANRPFGVASSIPATTCNIRVPGNENLSEADREARRNELFWPYHRAVERVLAARDERGLASIILSMHSFTPEPLFGDPRPWQIGILYGQDRRLAARLIEGLSSRRFSDGESITVGDNEPYRVTPGSDYGVPTYAEGPGRLGVIIELRQDCVATPSGVQKMRAVLGEVLAEIARDLAR